MYVRASGVDLCIRKEGSHNPTAGLIPIPIETCIFYTFLHIVCISIQSSMCMVVSRTYLCKYVNV